jgi:hypothetical protein
MYDARVFVGTYYTIKYDMLYMLLGGIFCYGNIIDYDVMWIV